VRLRSSARVVRRRGVLELRVDVSGPGTLAGRTVLVQRRVGGKVSTIRRVSVGPGGRATTFVRVPRSPAYTLRAVVAAGPSTLGAATPFAAVRTPPALLTRA
jgi:hypothetical protein